MPELKRYEESVESGTESSRRAASFLPVAKSSSSPVRRPLGCRLSCVHAARASRAPLSNPGYRRSTAEGRRTMMAKKVSSSIVASRRAHRVEVREPALRFDGGFSVALLL